MMKAVMKQTHCCYPGCFKPRAAARSSYCRQHWNLYQRRRRANEKTSELRAGLSLAIELFERIGDQPLTGRRAAELLTCLREDYLPQAAIFNFRFDPEQRAKALARAKPKLRDASDAGTASAVPTPSIATAIRTSPSGGTGAV
jgi:hypothetical protein